ncbi:MAG: lysophospholipid acyltransferase family protein [Candidatus Eiseniibacteriota bacterium]|jgi:KDO2-lipid IV(A) lauroyltransferase
MRRLRFAIEAAVFALLMQLARVLPFRLLQRIGSVAGSLFYLANGRHRRITHENLQACLGEELGPDGVRRVARAVWRHFGRITFDTLALPRLGPDSVGRLVHYEGLEHLREATARGRGVLAFSAHFGHWELAAVMQAHLGYPLALITRPLDNVRLERLLARLRGCSGNRVVHKRDAVKEMLRALNRKMGVAILIDQDARDAGIFVPYFGRLASTTPTLALLAARTGAALLPCFAVPRPDGSYHITYGPIVEWESSGDRATDVQHLTERCTAIVESWVRRHPEAWLWMHRRWKTRPPEETA